MVSAKVVLNDDWINALCGRDNTQWPDSGHILDRGNIDGSSRVAGFEEFLG